MRELMGNRDSGRVHNSSSIEKRTEKNSRTQTLTATARPRIHPFQGRSPGPVFYDWSGSLPNANVRP